MKSSPKRETILVVDDVPQTVEVLQRNLIAQGYEVLTAPGVAEALSITTTTPVDLVSYATDFLQPQRVAQFAFSPLESVEMMA